jgi:predicted DNA-binding protein (MmcQ/YjbR family)
MRDQRAVRRRVLRFALALPGAYEDHPWGESVAKVNNKVFVFLGAGDDVSTLGMTVKLRESHEEAVGISGAAPSGYGLGRWGWVTVPFSETSPPVGVLEDWVEESYRIVAPRTLVEELDGGSREGQEPKQSRKRPPLSKRRPRN